MNDGIEISEVSFIGTGLKRPECVSATKSGVLFASHAEADGRGGIACIHPNGQIEVILATDGDVPKQFVTNGYALLPDGSFLIANLGPEGGVYRLTRDGRLTLFLGEVDGRKLPPTNFVNRDHQGRLWISISTWHNPRDKAFRRGICDGCIVLVDNKGARIVADDVDFANENKTHPSGNWLYVHETMGRAVVRYKINSGGRLGSKEIVAEYGEGIFPDGFEFDEQGGVWVTSIVSNRILHVEPNGAQHVFLDAGDEELTIQAEAAYQRDEFNRYYQNSGNASPLGNCASLCFGGPDLRMIYIGSLASDRIACIRSPIAGAVPAHWPF